MRYAFFSGLFGGCFFGFIQGEIFSTWSVRFKYALRVPRPIYVLLRLISLARDAIQLFLSVRMAFSKSYSITEADKEERGSCDRWKSAGPGSDSVPDDLVTETWPP
jgi:hypothetical protein